MVRIPDEHPRPTGSSAFCQQCGAALTTHCVAGEPRNHWVCTGCGREHHEHPLIVVTAFIAWEQSLLWVRRAIEPKRGLWAIPGGYLEQGEPLREGAARELREEAGVQVDPEGLTLYMMGTLTFINQLYVGFRARVEEPVCVAGPESLECGFYDRQHCPWEDVAYPEVNDSIVQAYDDLASGQFAQWDAAMTGEQYQRHQVNTGPLVR